MSPKTITEYGDNPDILRWYIPDESVELIYPDPLNCNRNNNGLFKDYNLS